MRGAVIDFGTCGTGDPACDLAIGWTTFDDAALEAFQQYMDIDSSMWRRGAAWALWKALLTTRDPDPVGSARRFGWRLDATDVIRRVTRTG